jgi:hypothetical protein
MKKKFYYLSVLILTFMLVAGFNCGGVDNNNTEIETEDKPIATENDDDDSVIEDFKSALQINQAMKCTYKGVDDAGSVETTTYVEGDKYRSEYSSAGLDFVTVFDGKTMYSWDNNSKKGTKMDIKCFDDLETITEENGTEIDDYEEYRSSEDILDTGANVSCQKASKIDLEVPQDVEFVDQCAAFKQQLDALENIQDQLPDMEGLEIPKY